MELPAVTSPSENYEVKQEKFQHANHAWNWETVGEKWEQGMISITANSVAGAMSCAVSIKRKARPVASSLLIISSPPDC